MRWLFCAMAVLAPVQAAALSCVPHSVEAAYQQAAQSEDTFVIALGVLSFDPALMPVVDLNRQDETEPRTEIPALLRGRLLTQATGSVEIPLTLAVLCYGPWCAQAQDGAETLAFLKETPAGYELETNPCGGFMFQEPPAEMIRKVEECYRGAACEPPKC